MNKQELPGGLVVKDFALSLLWLIVTPVAWVQSLDQEIPHAADAAKEYLETNKNGNITYFWDSAKAVLRGKGIVINA